MTPLSIRTLKQKLAENPGQAYYYTNASYLLLGVAIEIAAGRPYEEYCRDAVLQPLGIGGARIDPYWGGVLSSFGGWRLSGPQYLRFLEAFADDSKVLGPRSKAYIADGEGKWINDRREVHYGLGTLVRGTATGRNVWHSGSWTYRYSNTMNRNLSESVGTYAVSLANGISWFAYYTPKPGDSVAAELDRTVTRGLNAVTAWPDVDLYPQYGLR